MELLDKDKKYGEYGEMITKGHYKINEKEKLFFSLTRHEELILTRELTNFISWSNKYLDTIESLLKQQRKSLYNENNIVSTKILTEFWFGIIGKPKEIEILLKNAKIVDDTYDYTKKYFHKISSLMPDFDFRMVSYNRYRTEEQKEKLLEILNRNNYSSRKLEKFLKTQKFDIDHIDKSNANNLIEKLF